MMKGLIILNWRMLTPEVFDVVANMDARGRIISSGMVEKRRRRKRNRDDLGECIT